MNYKLCLCLNEHNKQLYSTFLINNLIDIIKIINMDQATKNHLKEALKNGIDQKQIPQHLYKYRDKIEKVKDLLCKKQIYLSTVKQFNDPFEGKADIQSGGAEKNWYDYLIQQKMSGNDASKYAKYYHNNKAKGEKIIRQVITDVINQTGFYCLASKADNLLMWSHYADCHKGFCVEFDLSQDLDTFCTLSKVNYSNNYISYNYLIDQKGPYNTISHKSKDWEYEEEYRIIRQDQTGLLKINPKAITAIIFGCKTEQKDIDEIKKFIFGNSEYKHVILKQTVLDPKSYKLNIRVIKYS